MNSLIGLGHYTRATFRTSRWVLIIWPLILAIITVATAVAIAQYYPDAAARAEYSAALDIASVMSSIGGASGGLDQLGGIIANELAIMFIPAVAVAGVMLAVGRTRKEEDQGRTELLTAMPVGRLTPLAASYLAVFASVFFNAVLTVAIFVAFGVPLIGAEPGANGAASGGALPYGLLLLVYGLVFAGVGFVAAELADNSRTATTLGVGAFLVAYFVRVYVNGSYPHLWWTTPVGWFDRVAPFAQMRWGALALLAGLAVVLGGVAVWLRQRRDLGAGHIRARAGRASAPAWLGTPAGLTWRLVRTSVFSWLLVAIIFALIFGSQLQAWLDVFKQSNNILLEFGYEATSDSITEMVQLCLVIFASAVGIGQIGTFWKEEQASRVAFLLSKPLSRRTYMSVVIGVAMLSAVVVMLISGLVYALAARASVRSFDVGSAMSATLVYCVPVLLAIAAAAFTVGALRQGTWLGWVLFGVGITIAFMGDIMRLPDWARELGIYNLVGLVPSEPVNWVGVGIEVAATVALGVGAVRGFEKRELIGS